MNYTTKLARVTGYQPFLHIGFPIQFFVDNDKSRSYFHSMRCTEYPLLWERLHCRFQYSDRGTKEGRTADMVRFQLPPASTPGTKGSNVLRGQREYAKQAPRFSEAKFIYANIVFITTRDPYLYRQAFFKPIWPDNWLTGWRSNIAAFTFGACCRGGFCFPSPKPDPTPTFTVELTTLSCSVDGCLDCPDHLSSVQQASPEASTC